MNRWLRRFALLLAAPAAMAQALAQPAATPEASVKAAFLYKFANYVEWPPSAFESPAAPLVIGVAGSDEIARELERIVPGRSVNGHAVQVKRLKDGEGAAGVHVLFVAHDFPSLHELLRSVQSQPVLTVTESAHGFEVGSVINFVPAGERVGFEVSLDSAEKGGLRISARMLAVARRVIPRA